MLFNMIKNGIKYRKNLLEEIKKCVIVDIEEY